MATPANPLATEEQRISARPTNPRCQFCECTLTPTGEVIMVGEKAKVFRERGEEIEALRKQSEEKDKRINELAEAVKVLEGRSTREEGRPLGKAY